MNEICIQILREKLAEIKKQAEAVDDANLHDAVHALENAFDPGAPGFTGRGCAVIQYCGSDHEEKRNLYTLIGARAFACAPFFYAQKCQQIGVNTAATL